MLNLLHLFAGDCANSPGTFDTSCLPDITKATSSTTEIQAVLSIVFGVAGALALLMLIISGLRYIIANGDPQAMGRAKNSIIYSLVGLAVALSAEAIVNFVVGNL